MNHIGYAERIVIDEIWYYDSAINIVFVQRAWTGGGLKFVSNADARERGAACCGGTCIVCIPLLHDIS
jgi:hypothetical protein